MFNLATILKKVETHKKFIAYATAIVGLCTALYQLYDHIYDAGYTAAKVAIQAEQNKLIEKMNADHALEIRAAVSLVQQDFDKEVQRIKSQQEVKEIVKEKVIYVDREIPVEIDNECVALADSVVRMLKQATSIVGGHDTKPD